MIKESIDTTITELLQKLVHAVNGSEYRVCSSDEQAFFTNVHDLNVISGKGAETAVS
jgi:hypothetical protein